MIPSHNEPQTPQNNLEAALDQLDLAGVLVLQGILNQKAIQLLLGPQDTVEVKKANAKSKLVLPNRSAISM